jgi:hypothetical protein
MNSNKAKRIKQVEKERGSQTQVVQTEIDDKLRWWESGK